MNQKQKNQKKIKQKKTNQQSFHQKKNYQKTQIECISLDDNGLGIFSFQNIVYRVSNLLPKEEALVEILDNKKARVLKIVTPSINRGPVKCDIYDKCGSCHLLHMNYLEQLEFKKQYFIKAYQELGIDVNVDFMIGAKKKQGYRNKMQVAYKYEKGVAKYGFYEENTHNVIQVNRCLVQTELQQKIADYVFEFIKKNKIEIYNEDKRKGIIRYLLLKEGFTTKEVMVVIVTNGNILPSSSFLVKELKTNFPEIKTIVQNINNRSTNIILGEEEKVLYGDGFIYDYLLDKKFKISSKSFFQINPEQTEKMYNKIIEFAAFKSKDIVMDAYSGVGTIGILVSDSVKQIISVESNKTAVEDAIINSKINKINNVRFICEDATVFLENLTKENVKLDGIIIDPPRKGSTESFLNNIINLKIKKIVYVSCEPKTQARDVLLLINKGYKIIKTAVIDMFCGTNNVESICYLEYKGE